MKNARKLASFLLALVMVLSLATTVFAAAGDPGKITIGGSDDGVSVAGKTFNAYKILDLEIVGSGSDTTYAYTVPAEMKDFYKTRYSLTGDEENFNALVIKKVGEETDRLAFAAEALTAAKTAYGNAPHGTATAGENATSVQIANLPLGYYVVEDAGMATPISTLLLTSTSPEASIKIKADAPNVNKWIDGATDTDDSTTTDVKYNNAAVGDKIPYKVTTSVPNMFGYKHYYFVLTDVMSKGLKFNNDVAIVMKNADGATIKTLAKDTDFTVEQTGNSESADGTTIQIIFKNFIQYNTDEFKNADILVTYSAELTEDAVIGTAGNPNKVKLTFSNNPNVKEDGTPDDKPGTTSPVGNTPWHEVRTYVTGIQIIKIDPQGNRLTGAKFKLTGTKLNTVLVTADTYTEDATGTYWKLTDGTYTTDDPTTPGMDQTKYESTTKKYSKTTTTTPVVKAENVEYVGVVGSDGVLRFDGLSAGEYDIEELIAPAGYNVLQGEIHVSITCTVPTDTATKEDCTWAYTYTGAGMSSATGTNNTVTVTNRAGTLLPTTGGTGTTIFYVVGSILLLGAVVLLVTKKRMAVAK